MRNYRIVLSYDGTDFQGWQTQPGYRTVQETLETALKQLTGEAKVRVNASGRTDAGVHALGQVANFYSAMTVPFHKLLGAINAHLPDDIVVHSVEEASQSFDANRDAIRKLYRYVIHDGAMPSPFLRKYCCQSKHTLDVAAMARKSRMRCACDAISGPTHRSRNGGPSTTRCTLTKAESAPQARDARR